MPVISRPDEFNVDDLYIDLEPVLGSRLFLKCEGFNFGGSIKMKAALRMVAQAEQDGRLGPGGTLVESSSGNLGIALAVIAASRGYGFVCVTDSRCNLAARQVMQTLGGEVHVITEPDAEHGLLGARIKHVRRLCAADRSIVWLNQYENEDNWRAHYATPAPDIVRHFPDLDVLFVGAGTTGTLMGCARYLRELARPVRVVAVDSVGSVTFGAPASPRMIPGVGTSVRPALLDESIVDDVVWVPEVDTIRTCHRLAREGFLFGGSTGTVVAGAARWLEENAVGPTVTAAALAPDMGERYLDSIYQPNWLRAIYGEDALPATGTLAS